MGNVSIISQPNVHIVNVSAAIYISDLNTLYRKFIACPTGGSAVLCCSR